MPPDSPSRADLVRARVTAGLDPDQAEAIQKKQEEADAQAAAEAKPSRGRKAGAADTAD